VAAAADLQPARQLQPDQLVVPVVRAGDDPGHRGVRRDSAVPRRAVAGRRPVPGDRDGHRLGPHHHLDRAPQRRVGREPPELAVDHPVTGGAGHDLGRPQELGGPPGGRRGVHVLGRAGLLDPAVAHDDDHVGERQGLLLVVGDEQGAGAGGPEDRGDLLAQRHPQPGVERGERLVEQHDLGLVGQGPGEGDALALAARQLVGVGPGPVGEADQLEALLDAARPRLAEADVAGHGQVREQRTVLEDHAHPPLVGLLPRAVAGDEPVADGDGAGVGHLEAGDDPQQRRLARAARPEQGHELALPDLQRRPGDRPRAAERLVDVAGPDRGRAAHDPTLGDGDIGSSGCTPAPIRRT
jgi:hypothetical protein